MRGNLSKLLMGDVRLEEVKDAIFSMGAMKALGTDGFPPIFYQSIGSGWSKPVGIS